MNAIAFATKRAFHGFLRFTRKPFASIGLTAARFDLLFLLPFPTGRCRPKTRWQSDLWRNLGVTPGVVSRMLRSLEALGLVTRTRGDLPGDRRQVLVALTRRGEECVREALSWVVRRVQLRVVASICWGEHRDPARRTHHVNALEAYLTNLRRDLGDTALLNYRWAPPDDRAAYPALTNAAL
jgi:DNA-binding MarR family transcriptional regulator